jgi:hypothetical protein
MGNAYIPNKSVFKDIFIEYVIKYPDFGSNDNAVQAFHLDVLEYMKNFVTNPADFELFDYEIIEKNEDPDNLVVLGMNLTSCLWIMGIIPHNALLLEKQGELVYKKKKYTYDEENYCLKTEIIK